MVLWTIKTVQSWAEAIKTPGWIQWLKRSAEEDNGKPSGKRLSGGLAMVLVAYDVISAVSFGTNPHIEVIMLLLGFAAACFAISYIPTRGVLPTTTTTTTAETKKEDELPKP
jgi:F0F1-type ATP synthase assembly protein I